MDERDISERITEARGWALLGLHTEAMDLLETLPTAERGTASVFAVALIICTGQGMWGAGMELAEAFTPESHPEQREAAGRFYLAHAVHLMERGNRAQAKVQVGRLAVIWPEGRLEALRNRGLKGLF